MGPDGAGHAERTVGVFCGVLSLNLLASTGVFDHWVQQCPLHYTSGNAPAKRDMLGTLVLAILAGHRRYAHVTALLGDAVAAQALGMNRVVSEDALRRALSRIDSQASDQWLRPALLSSVRDALDRPWILDIDASIKPLYGRHNEGAELGYNPHKPGWLTTIAQPCPAHLLGGQPALG